MHPAALDPDALLAQCDIRHTKASGPGGQHRNKVQTAVVITHRPTGVIGQASERRSQAQNREVALFRLRVNLALAVRDAGNDVSRFRLPVNSSHDDFPAVLAAALDAIAAHNDDVKASAAVLGCSTTQLVKLVATEPRAMEHVNAQRADRGLRQLLPNK